MMEIYDAASFGKKAWNEFIKQHSPPIGAFMQTWEWGEFQRMLGRKVERYFLSENKEPVAVFTLIHHLLPFNLSYGYVPRGPIIAASHSPESKSLEIFNAIKKWAASNFPNLIFLRLEPPVTSVDFNKIKKSGFYVPSYYVQPRYNHAVHIDKTEEEIIAGFHPSTRSNIGRAEKRGVTVEIKPFVSETDFEQFIAMTKDTIQRNSGKNAYPNNSYFRSLFKIIPPLNETNSASDLLMGIFYGYHEKEPAAAHFVVFFGDTATYLFGASYKKKLNSKVATYLHWDAMKEARKRGLKFYDLGGIDETRWPTLTQFKRQFRGQEFKYVGNIDIPLRPALYLLYNMLRKLGKLH